MKVYTVHISLALLFECQILGRYRSGACIQQFTACTNFANGHSNNIKLNIWTTKTLDNPLNLGTMLTVTLPPPVAIGSLDILAGCRGYEERSGDLV
jgi:hypothetical protein